jgi:hypothetical protein
VRRQARARLALNANGELALYPPFEIGDECFREVMPMAGSALLERVIQMTSRYSRYGDCVAAEVVKVVGNESEPILIAACRREPIGATCIFAAR